VKESIGIRLVCKHLRIWSVHIRYLFSYGKHTAAMKLFDAGATLEAPEPLVNVTILTPVSVRLHVSSRTIGMGSLSITSAGGACKQEYLSDS
jgi:hypothetical protein